MKNLVSIAFGVFILFSSQIKAQETLLRTENLGSKDNTINTYTVKDIYGEEYSFKQLSGSKILIVNTASKCGFTPQYKELETLYQKYKAKNFVIIGFPSNDFGGQEPGSNKQIAEFCSKNYGVTFPMMEKVTVKGKGMCELYQFLTQASKNGLIDSEVKWNFQKYLINENGELVAVLDSKVAPMDKKITNWIEGKKVDFNSNSDQNPNGARTR